MIPDVGFTRQLKKLDKELEVVWDRGTEKWEIWRFPKETGKLPLHMTTVEAKGKTYRELGADVLIKLQQGDPRRYSLKELIDYWEEMDKQIQRRKTKELTDKIDAIARETFRFARGVLQVQVPKNIIVERAING